MTDFLFTVDSALLSELGEKLVESVHVALMELVKNSYDADATKITVKMIPNATGGPEIHIIDNGTGMTLEEVRAYWMKIATTNKVENQVSPIFGRPRTGAKGIGRFCCRRLGTNLRLITIAKKRDGSRERTEVVFDWLKFEPGKDVTEIKCPGESGLEKSHPAGTTLIIKGSSRDEWKQRGFDFLKRQLAVLAANRGMKRRGFQEDTGFEIHLDVPQFKGGIGDLREQLISAGWGTLTAHIDGQGYGACELDAMGIRQKQIKTGKQFSHLAGVKLKIGILIDKKEQLRDKGILSKGNLQKILPEWGGVQIRYNGFRVYPYGDDDWLDIDHDRGLRRGTTEGQLSSFAQKLKGVDPGRALLSLLSMRSYVGTVEVDSKAKGFELKVNREGFLQSEAVGELKEFVRFCIDWSTIYRDYFLKQQDKSEAEGARQHLQEVLKKEVEPEHLVESAVEYIQKEIKSVSSLLPPQERRAISTSFRNATTAILKHDKAKKEELHHLRLIASTSTLLLIFSHEVKSLLGTLEGSTSSLRQIEGKLVSKDAETVAGIRAALSESKLRFSELIDMTSLIGVDSKSATPERLALGERVRDAKKCFKLILNGYDIQVDESLVPNSVKVGPMLEAELYAILLNVLSNSIKSVIAAGGAKEIQVEAIASGGKNLINIRDTGIGLAPSHFNDVFIPFVADPDGRLYANLNKKLNAQDRYIVGTGSGLGLAIIKEIVEFRKGSITFREPHGKWKAHLEIILP